MRKRWTARAGRHARHVGTGTNTRAAPSRLSVGSRGIIEARERGACPRRPGAFPARIVDVVPAHSRTDRGPRRSVRPPTAVSYLNTIRSQKYRAIAHAIQVLKVPVSVSRGPLFSLPAPPPSLFTGIKDSFL